MSAPVKDLARARWQWPNVHILKVRVGKGLHPGAGDGYFYIPPRHPLVCTSARTFEVIEVWPPDEE